MDRNTYHPNPFKSNKTESDQNLFLNILMKPWAVDTSCILLPRRFPRCTCCGIYRSVDTDSQVENFTKQLQMFTDYFAQIWQNSCFHQTKLRSNFPLVGASVAEIPSCSPAVSTTAGQAMSLIDYAIELTGWSRSSWMTWLEIEKGQDCSHDRCMISQNDAKWLKEWKHLNLGVGLISENSWPPNPGFEIHEILLEQVQARNFLRWPQGDWKDWCGEIWFAQHVVNVCNQVTPVFADTFRRS